MIELEYPTFDVFRMAVHPDYRKTYDVLFEEGGMQKKLGANTYLMYNKMKRISVVASRDFCVVLHPVKELNGVIKLVTYSIEHNDVPEKKGD